MCEDCFRFSIETTSPMSGLILKRPPNPVCGALTKNVAGTQWVHIFYTVALTSCWCRCSLRVRGPYSLDSSEDSFGVGTLFCKGVVLNLVLQEQLLCYGV